MPHARFAVRDCEHLQHRRMELSHREHGPLTMLHLSLCPTVYFKCGSAGLLEPVNPASAIVLMFNEGDVKCRTNRTWSCGRYRPRQ
jgi:hypothetical protein